MGFFSKLVAFFTPTPYVYPGYQYGKSYPRYNGSVRYIELWTCKECLTMTKSYGKHSGYKCRNKKCAGDMVVSVRYWKDREAKGMPYVGPTVFVPTPRRSAEDRHALYDFQKAHGGLTPQQYIRRRLSAFKAEGLTHREALLRYEKEENCKLAGPNGEFYYGTSVRPETAWPPEYGNGGTITVVPRKRARG